MDKSASTSRAMTAHPLHGPVIRGGGRPRVAIVGRAGNGKASIFRAASSTATRHERLAGIGPAYEECLVEVGVEQISLVALPDIDSFHHLHGDAAVVLKYLLWGDRWPAIARHESHQPEKAFPWWWMPPTWSATWNWPWSSRNWAGPW